MGKPETLRKIAENCDKLAKNWRKLQEIEGLNPPPPCPWRPGRHPNPTGSRGTPPPLLNGAQPGPGMSTVGGHGPGAYNTLAPPSPALSPPRGERAHTQPPSAAPPPPIPQQPPHIGLASYPRSSTRLGLCWGLGSSGIAQRTHHIWCGACGSETGPLLTDPPPPGAGGGSGGCAALPSPGQPPSPTSQTDSFGRKSEIYERGHLRPFKVHKHFFSLCPSPPPPHPPTTELSNSPNLDFGVWKKCETWGKWKKNLGGAGK